MATVKGTDGSAMMTRALPALVIIVIAGTVGGCGCNEQTIGDPDATDTVDDGDDVCIMDAYCMDDAVTCFEGGCHAPPYSETCIGGHVVDSTGAPKQCQMVVACTNGRCYSGRSDAEGFFTVWIEDDSHPDMSLYFPVPTDRTGHHSPFCHYTEFCDGEVHLCDEFVLYEAPTMGEAVPESTGPTDPNPLPADVRVEASDGGALVFHAGDEVDLPMFTEPWVALTRFPLDEHVPCFLDPSNLPLALYAVTPMDTMVIEPGTHLEPILRTARLDLPNETDLAAGTDVGIYVLGGVHPPAGMAEGEWLRVAGATVTSDGTRIQTADGAGPGYLTWVGVYLP